MKLWRLDAMHEVEDAEGAMSLFFRAKPEALIRENFLAQNGWMTDVYHEEMGPLDSWAIGRLVHNFWPVASSLVIIELVAAKRPACFAQREGAVT